MSLLKLDDLDVLEHHEKSYRELVLMEEEVHNVNGEGMDELEILEKSSRKLVLDEEEVQSVSKEVLEYVNNFWTELSRYKAFNNKLTSCEYIFKQKIEGKGTNLKDLLDLFDDSVIHSGIQTTSGKDMGHIPSGGVPLSAFGDFIAAATNKHVAVYSICPGGVNIENQILRWTASLFGFNESRFGGNISSGGSLATLLCIAAARDKNNMKARDFDKAVIYLSQESHFCVDRALVTLGMRESVVRKIPVDSKFRMDTAMLQKTIETDAKNGLIPLIVCGSFGTTSTGSIDDLQRLSSIAKEFGCWFHVDAAYGGFFVLLEEIKNRFKGIDLADSLVIDPHKSLFMPYGCGIALVKERADLLRVFSYSAAFLDNTQNGDPSPADVSPELTRHFRGLRMWFPLLYHGIDLFKDALREKILLTKYAYKKMKDLHYIELGPISPLTIFVFRFNGKNVRDGKHSHESLNLLNKDIYNAFLVDGRSYISNTIINGVFWFRVAILNVRTHKEEIDTLLDMIKSVILRSENG